MKKTISEDQIRTEVAPKRIGMTGFKAAIVGMSLGVAVLTGCISDDKNCTDTDTGTSADPIGSGDVCSDSD